MNTLETAQSYVNAGFSVIPIGANKVPAISWREFCTRLPTQDELNSWFSKPAGIGIVCGAVSGNLEVTDIDIEDIDETNEFVKFLIKNTIETCEDMGVDHSPLENISIIRTPRNGCHIYYRCTKPVSGSQKLARHIGKLDPNTGKFDGKPGYHIETRGEGGYVLAPGSPEFCHPLGGQKYSHFAGRQITEIVPAFTPLLRDIWLTEAKFLGSDGIPYENSQEMKEALESEEQEKQAQRTSVSVPADYGQPQDSPSDDFSMRVSWADILEPHGFTHTSRQGEKDVWKHSNATNVQSATTNHDGSNLFYAFSPNCHTALETNRGYSKFSVYTALNFGDHSKEAFQLAVKQLRNDGYGEQIPECVDMDSVMKNLSRPAEDSKSPNDTRRISLLSYEDFMKIDSPEEFYCEDILVKGQSCVLGGKEKTLKTTLALDLLLSIGSGLPFLGVYECKERVNTGFLTGESGIAKLQRSAATIMASKQVVQLDEPVDDRPPSFYIAQTLPDLSSIESLQQVEQMIIDYELKVLGIDPIYLCLGKYANDTSNVSVMGNMLRSIDEIAKRTGCTFIILHHTNRKNENNEPLNLRDLSGAGFAEWARQWILLSTRVDFDPERHEHKLWMVTGGSAGHAGKWGVDVREKDDSGEWVWDCGVKTIGQEKRDHKEARDHKKAEAEKGKQEEFHTHLKQALQEAGEAGATINELKKVFTKNSWAGVTKISMSTISDFIEAGFVEAGQGSRGNGQIVAVYMPAGSWVETIDIELAATAEF